MLQNTQSSSMLHRRQNNKLSVCCQNTQVWVLACFVEGRTSYQSAVRTRRVLACFVEGRTSYQSAVRCFVEGWATSYQSAVWTRRVRVLACFVEGRTRSYQSAVWTGRVRVLACFVEGRTTSYQSAVRTRRVLACFVEGRATSHEFAVRTHSVAKPFTAAHCLMLPTNVLGDGGGICDNAKTYSTDKFSFHFFLNNFNSPL